MFELTNEQRICFALRAVDKRWKRIEAKPSPYDDFKTYLYIDGDRVVKCIMCSAHRYGELEFNEQLSADGKYLLPKTNRGKPVLLSSATILKRTAVGMSLNCVNDYISLCDDNYYLTYYSNNYDDSHITDIGGFARWVEQWCSETTPQDIEDVNRFAQQKRSHVRFKEGDVFRFKIGRRLYGYGRILLDYDRMRREHVPFWDILMTKPVLCSVYHIVTERADVAVEELRKLMSLPSIVIADEELYYGSYSIIGNLPVTDNEDYPIMYGKSIDVRENAVCYQCGKTYRKIVNGTLLYPGFTNNSVWRSMPILLRVLQQCIDAHSNAPYWSSYYPACVSDDLRTPQHSDKLRAIRRQFGLNDDGSQPDAGGGAH